MKVAVTASGPDLTSRLEPSFSSAAYFVIFDTASHEFRWHPNGPEFVPRAGEEAAAARELVQLNIDVLMTGRINSALAACLEASGVQVCCHRWETVTDAWRSSSDSYKCRNRHFAEESPGRSSSSGRIA